MKQNRVIIFVLVAMFGLLVSTSGAQEGNVLRYNWGGSDLPSLDPSLATDVSSIQVIVELFPALTRINNLSLESEPGMATWEVSEDGLTYTFSIVEDVPWVQFNAETGEVEQALDEEGNVRFVTADDFVFGMQRSMDPRNGSYYGGILANWVDGGSAFNGSIDDAAEDASDEDLAALVEAAVDSINVTVVDDYTLEVGVAQPAGFVPQILGLWMSTAQPSWVVEEFGDVWTEPENIASYGPFTLSEWLNGERLTIVRNPFWPGTDTIPVPTLDAVTGPMLEPLAALDSYEAGLLDVVGVPGQQLDRVLADPVLSTEYTTGEDTCTFYLGVNTTLAPTDDVRVRQALSIAVDRQAIADAIIRPASPAFFFSRPSLAAAPTLDTNPEVAIGDDLAQAQALIDDYIAENGEIPTITFMHSATSSSGPLLAAATQEMWSDAFGELDIEVQTQEWAVFLETTDDTETAPNLWYIGWCLDYPDANNFLFDVFHSSVIDDGTGFRNEEFDALVAEAQTLTDLEERRALYARAEEILVNEAVAIIPLVYDETSVLTKPYVERQYGLTNTAYFELWSINAE